MKNLLLIAAVLGLFASVSAPAQNSDHHDDNAHQNGNVPAHARGVGSGQAGHAANTNMYLPASGDVHPDPSDRPATNRTQNNAGWSGNGTGQQPANNSRQGNQNWSHSASGHHPDVTGLQRNMQSTRRFHGNSYNAPRGYRYRHWSYGERLPRGYFVRSYWISSFMMYGLFAPPDGLVWVRVGSDALLIDRESGDIVQVRYGVFY